MSLRTRHSFQYLYPLRYFARLYLNTFRGEPAITWFDWYIAPNHRSSERIATHIGSDLQPTLVGFHPAHG